MYNLNCPNSCVGLLLCYIVAETAGKKRPSYKNMAKKVAGPRTPGSLSSRPQAGMATDADLHGPEALPLEGENPGKVREETSSIR